MHACMQCTRKACHLSDAAPTAASYEEAFCEESRASQFSSHNTYMHTCALRLLLPPSVKSAAALLGVMAPPATAASTGVEREP